MISLIKILYFFCTSIFIFLNGYFELHTYLELIYIYCIFCYISLIWIDMYNGKKITPYLIFQIPFGLFILGRVFGWMLDTNLEPKDISFFKQITLSNYEIAYYLLISILFFNSCSLGYDFSKKISILKSKTCPPPIDKHIIKYFVFFIVTIFTPLLVLELIQILNVVVTNGYAAMYIYKKENVGTTLSMGLTALTVSLGLAVLSEQKNIVKLLMVILFLVCAVLFFLGARGPIMTFFLLYLWVFHRKDSIHKIVAWGVAAIVLIQILNNLVRTMANGDNLFAKFIYDQGTTFIILPFIEYIESWPTVGLLQNFIPGISRFLSIFISYPAIEANLSNFLAYNLDSSLQERGFGLGWTIIADIYIYSGYFLPLFAIIAILIGFILGKFDFVTSKNASFRFGLITTLILQLSFLYRSGLFSIIPLAIYFSVTYLFLATLTFILKKRPHGD